MKKLLGIVCAALMLVALGASAYAYDMVGSPDPMNVYYEATDTGLEVGNNWVGLGVTVNNDGTELGIVENATMYDITEQAELGNYLVVIYTAGSDGSPVISYNHAEAETYGVELTAYEIGDENIAFVNLGDALAAFGGDEYQDIALKIDDENAVILAVYALDEAPIKTVTTDEDVPTTGIALAFVPMAIATATLIVSKKR